ncbi:SH2 domain-containing protein 3C isoform X1 [Oxyura jamaicensis]|uniref:SH2 domain-containing protein 3C isoform X1 n=1 Tax=Oxyura jamaicensis TaxID=8884 RepID=UPI0015A59341|nr:SH2 domain-containing protein 3C isoform X1 [Oxyura jamaicensis]XP_035197626.1 SH2 domain-containing protein 3C isoform X1 [Oxyura jamaicensis]
MAEGQKRGGFKKFKFFKFKGFGSLSSIPRSFTLRRGAVAPSSSESGEGALPPHGFLEEPFSSTQDDLNTMPKSPGPYARSSDMYSHMGTMPRQNPGKVGKSPGKARGTQSCRDKGTPRDKMPGATPVSGPKSPETPGTPDAGTAPSSASGKAEQEEEEALPSGTPAAAMARMDQEPAGSISCPNTEAPSPKLAPSPTPGTTTRDLLGKGQEHPSEGSPDSHHNGLESGSEYVKFSKEKYILDSSPEKLHKELEEELKLSSTDLRSHAWYHGRIPREVSESLVQRNGDFLIRDSLTSLGDYVLTCRWRNEPLHFKINKATVKSSDGHTRVQYLFEQESFDNVPALVRFYVGNRKAISEQSGAIVYCPINRTFPLRYLEASYGLANGKHGAPHSPAAQKGGHIKRRSITMTDGLTADKITRAEGCPTSVSLPHHRDIIRNCAVSVDQIQDLHAPMSPISENPTSPAYSTVTRLKPHTCQAAGISPASPVIRRSSEPQLCPGSNSKPLPDPAHSTHSTPCHGYARASPSPSVNSYSDPDTGHYCQLHPTSPVGRERPAHDTKPAKSYVERLKVEEGQRGTVENGSGEAEAGQRLKGERDFVGFVPPTMETSSSFNPAAFQSLLIPLENKPLEMAVLKKVKELLAEVDAKTLAKHITKVDCVVARILGVTAETQRLMGVSSGMELLTLPHGHQLRLDLLERFHTMSIMIAVDILGCTGSTEERAALLHKTIQLAAELKSTMGNMFSFAAVMNALEMTQIARLEQTWMVLRQRHTEGAILYEKKLKPFLKSLNEGKEGPPLTNTTFPHVVPLVTLLERDDALVDNPEPWETTDNGVEVVMAHLEAARMVAHHGGLYHTNAEVKLQGFQGRAELLEIFSTEFQLRLLWGSRGAESSQAERYEKFDKVLTALSHKLEPAVRFSEL